MKLYIIRHGQTDWNVLDKIQGRRDIPLNAVGKAQAAGLAKGMERRPVTAVYSSPQKRAWETAMSIAENQGVPIYPLDSLAEISYGEWEGRTSRDIMSNDQALYESWRQHPATVAPPGGESLSQVDGRCHAAWEYIRSRLTGDTAIVAHGGTLAHFIVLLLKGQPGGKEIIVGNASITTIEYDPKEGSCRLLELNDSKHLQ